MKLPGAPTEHNHSAYACALPAWMQTRRRCNSADEERVSETGGHARMRQAKISSHQGAREFLHTIGLSFHPSHTLPPAPLSCYTSPCAVPKASRMAPKVASAAAASAEDAEDEAAEGSSLAEKESLPQIPSSCALYTAVATHTCQYACMHTLCLPTSLVLSTNQLGCQPPRAALTT